MAFPVLHLEAQDVGREMKVPIKGGGWITDVLASFSVSVSGSKAAPDKRVRVQFKHVNPRTPFSEGLSHEVDQGREIEFVE